MEEQQLDVIMVFMNNYWPHNFYQIRLFSNLDSVTAHYAVSALVEKGILTQLKEDNRPERFMINKELHESASNLTSTLSEEDKAYFKFKEDCENRKAYDEIIIARKTYDDTMNTILKKRRNEVAEMVQKFTVTN